MAFCDQTKPYLVWIGGVESENVSLLLFSAIGERKAWKVKFLVKKKKIKKKFEKDYPNTKLCVS